MGDLGNFLSLSQRHKVIKVFDAVEISAGGDSSSSAIDVAELDGLFSLQWEITGDGTGKFEVLTCNNGADFLDVSTDIAASQTKTSGPGSDGKNMAAFQPVVCGLIKIKATETGGAHSITVSAWLKGY